MKLVVGLGNPGEKYKNTRHNVGFLVVERLAGESEWTLDKKLATLRTLKKTESTENNEILLIKPQDYMNKSGVAVKAVLKKHFGKWKGANLPFLWVIHDDLDIELGKYKIGKKGPREHNGLKSIYEQIGTKDFWHVRVGIARYSPGKICKKDKEKGVFTPLINRSQKTVTGTDYVLSSWRPEERDIIDKVIIKIVEELKDVLA
ncbi:MAG: aminoacyl-tRNA hydrolase [Candidatus Beckwithbacteria bacterium]|nr:aminoacyl-tRNA hydrolase [Patescibacteria group bacterium]